MSQVEGEHQAEGRLPAPEAQLRDQASAQRRRAQSAGRERRGRVATPTGTSIQNTALTRPRRCWPGPGRHRRAGPQPRATSSEVPSMAIAFALAGPAYSVPMSDSAEGSSAARHPGRTVRPRGRPGRGERAAGRRRSDEQRHPRRQHRAVPQRSPSRPAGTSRTAKLRRSRPRPTRRRRRWCAAVPA